MAQSLAEMIAAKKAASLNGAAPVLPLADTPRSQEDAALPDAAPPLSPSTQTLMQKISAAAQEEATKPSTLTIPSGSINTTRIIPNVDEILPRIRALELLGDEVLEDEMTLLKEALLLNPEASATLLPTDVGLLVKALRRVVGDSIAAAANNKKSKKSKQMTIEEMEAAALEL